MMTYVSLSFVSSSLFFFPSLYFPSLFIFCLMCHCLCLFHFHFHFPSLFFFLQYYERIRIKTEQGPMSSQPSSTSTWRGEWNSFRIIRHSVHLCRGLRTQRRLSLCGLRYSWSKLLDNQDGLDVDVHGRRLGGKLRFWHSTRAHHINRYWRSTTHDLKGGDE